MLKVVTDIDETFSSEGFCFCFFVLFLCYCFMIMVNLVGLFCV
ncbi:hypothetical protein AALP_AA7G182000 [Arabis alpina]|uniref:Uncharacterized protein n=1 Tax=Arabis alpina TaxID=50452 RepID=A0A087GIW0_ARAAL|nr:hypothetical protein AALP_AA7G182000 [Arabis alpina]